MSNRFAIARDGVREVARLAVLNAHYRAIRHARLAHLRQAAFDLNGAASDSSRAAAWMLLAVVASWLADPSGDLDGGTSDAHLDADDADESGSASCAAEGTGGLVVDVTAPADDEGLHDEEGSRDE